MAKLKAPPRTANVERWTQFLFPQLKNEIEELEKANSKLRGVIGDLEYHLLAARAEKAAAEQWTNTTQIHLSKIAEVVYKPSGDTMLQYKFEHLLEKIEQQFK